MYAITFASTLQYFWKYAKVYTHTQVRIIYGIFGLRNTLWHNLTGGSTKYNAAQHFHRQDAVQLLPTYHTDLHVHSMVQTVVGAPRTRLADLLPGVGLMTLLNTTCTAVRA
jgi:hypothetical protein